jgi:hypothetical protein
MQKTASQIADEVLEKLSGGLAASLIGNIKGFAGNVRKGFQGANPAGKISPALSRSVSGVNMADAAQQGVRRGATGAMTKNPFAGLGGPLG